MGVPLGTYDFGGTIGVKSVGQADTIIQRLSFVPYPIGITPLVLSAWQLETLAPTSIGGGPVGFYYLTLQSARGGPASTGTENILALSDTFSPTLDVFYDLRFGALNGPIVNSSDMVLSASGDWQHDGRAQTR